MEHGVDIAKELKNYIEDPLSNYNTNSCDMYLIALARHFQTNISIIHADAKKSWVANFDDINADTKTILYFGKSVADHIDPILPSGLKNPKKEDIEVIILSDSDINTCIDNHNSSSSDFDIDDNCGSNHISSGNDSHVDLLFSATPWEEKKEIISGTMGNVSFQGKRRYISPSAFSSANSLSVDRVPDDVNGTVVFMLKINEERDLSKLKGGRPWAKAYTSYTKSHPKEKGPRLLMDCRGTFECINEKCPNRDDFQVNKTEFTEKNKVVLCSHCKSKADYKHCNARIIIEKDIQNQVAVVRHYGIMNVYLSRGC